MQTHDTLLSSPHGVFVKSPHGVFDTTMPVIDAGYIGMAWLDEDSSYAIGTLWADDLADYRASVRSWSRSERVLAIGTLLHVEGGDPLLNIPPSSLIRIAPVVRGPSFETNRSIFVEASQSTTRLDGRAMKTIDEIRLFIDASGSMGRDVLEPGISRFTSWLYSRRGKEIAAGSNITLAEDATIIVSEFRDERWVRILRPLPP